jgi:hypothetical protein
MTRPGRRGGAGTLCHAERLQRSSQRADQTAITSTSVEGLDGQCGSGQIKCGRQSGIVIIEYYEDAVGAFRKAM